MNDKEPTPYLLANDLITFVRGDDGKSIKIFALKDNRQEPEVTEKIKHRIHEQFFNTTDAEIGKFIEQLAKNRTSVKYGKLNSFLDEEFTKVMQPKNNYSETNQLAAEHKKRKTVENNMLKIGTAITLATGAAMLSKCGDEANHNQLELPASHAAQVADTSRNAIDTSVINVGNKVSQVNDSAKGQPAVSRS